MKHNQLLYVNAMKNGNSSRFYCFAATESKFLYKFVFWKLRVIDLCDFYFDVQWISCPFLLWDIDLWSIDCIRFGVQKFFVRPLLSLSRSLDKPPLQSRVCGILKHNEIFRFILIAWNHQWMLVITPSHRLCFED